MSSGSEDEDELLQMALKEQSKRDVNYQKAASNRRPVANYVQAPPPPPNKKPPAQQQKRRVVDDDDESDVDMLSISSGDEDSTFRDQQRVRFRGSSGAAASRPKDDDAAPWDGDEPGCWKHVDEAELARRVRGMRETRAAPVAIKVERKVSSNAVLARKGLNTLLSFPRGMECIDPLGLGSVHFHFTSIRFLFESINTLVSYIPALHFCGVLCYNSIIDNKTLRLITESSDYSPTKDDKLDNTLREKLLYFSEKFDAKLFISRIHQVTSAADLEAGALALKSDLIGRTQQRKQLVKDNFDCFVSCKTTIDDIESKLKRIEEDPEGSGTAHLFKCMEGVSSLANRAFQHLFERQVEAEKIRSVQGMLQRFRTLFNLPSTIRGSISKGEYDLAVREYKKAKSIALPSHVGILKRVLEEVEKVMHEFKGTLYKSMEDPQIDLTNLENTVRLLLELEPESDPVWHYLNIQNNRIRGLLEKWKQIQQDTNHSSDAVTSENNSLLVDSVVVDLTGEEVDALRGRYILRLTAVLTHHIPAFWKVALSVFNGKFAKSSQVSSESNATTPANKSEEKVGDGKYSTHSLEEVSVMIRNTITAYEVKVCNTFRDLEESNILQPYMSDAIIEISKACEAFEAKESSPSIAVIATRALQSEITKIYILRLCSWMRASTVEISKDEAWVPVSVLERNKSPYTISYLPLAFRSVMTSAMDQIKLMIQKLRSEATRSEDMFAQLQDIQESVRLAFLNCILDFAGHLERIGSELAQNRSGKGSSHVENGYSQNLEDNLIFDLMGSVVGPHQKLLIVLSNIGYCKDELSYELYNNYKHIWLQSREREEEDSDIQDLVMSFSGLEEKVLEQYTFAKVSSFMH
ncbi:hypothetical protein ACLB2K_073536 [Fragaria x ananassa]